MEFNTVMFIFLARYVLVWKFLYRSFSLATPSVIQQDSDLQIHLGEGAYADFVLH